MNRCVGRLDVHSEFSVVAIIAAFNEADVIEHVIEDLIQQDIGVYVLDDGSTDATVEIVSKYLNRGVLKIEHLPPSSPAGFDLEKILWRKSELAQELDASWFIHADADEFRESPWPYASLKQAIEQVNALGYNAIDFVVFEFHPDHDAFQAGTDVREALKYYTRPAVYDRLQVRCWKKSDTPVDLTASGGHEALFAGREIFPIPFVLRHYPIRSQAHGVRKVLCERRPRVLQRERARNWHVQYDGIKEGVSFIRDSSQLTPYDAVSIRHSLAIRDLDARPSDPRIPHLRAELESCRRQLETSRVEQDRLLAQKQHVIDALNAAATMTLHENDRLRGEMESSIQEARELADTVAAITQSRSWRWMLPARTVLRMLRGY